MPKKDGTQAKSYIQWKGTDVCMDVHCSCGHHSHFDSEFLYYLRCPSCGQIYQVGETVQLSPLDEQEVQALKESYDPEFWKEANA